MDGEKSNTKRGLTVTWATVFEAFHAENYERCLIYAHRLFEDALIEMVGHRRGTPIPESLRRVRGEPKYRSSGSLSVANTFRNKWPM